MGDNQDRYAQRPRFYICLGAGSLNSYLVRGPISCFFTRCLFLFSSLLFSCGVHTQLVVLPDRAPNMPDRRRTMLKICQLICPAWFSAGLPHPLASRPTLEIFCCWCVCLQPYNAPPQHLRRRYGQHIYGPLYSFTQRARACTVPSCPCYRKVSSC